MYSLEGDVVVSGNITDGTFACDFTNITFVAKINTIDSTFTIDSNSIKNEEGNIFNNGNANTSFEVSFSMNGTYRKTSIATLELP
jgi:hypothetical protein